MRRNPSIHITVDALEHMLKDMGVASPKRKAWYILEESKKVTLQHRVYLKTNKATTAKLDKLLTTNELTVNMFNSALTNKRLTLHGTHIQQITKGSNQYNLLVETAGYAYEFYRLYGFEDEVIGYELFCEIGLRLMGKKYSLNKFKTNIQKIFDFYKYQLLIDNDPKQSDTIKFYKVYASLILKNTGLELTFEPGDYLRFIDFYYGRCEADKLKAKYTDYLTAQFDQMAFLGTVPERYNLHGENAKERYQKWLRSERFNNTDSKPGLDDDYMSII